MARINAARSLIRTYRSGTSRIASASRSPPLLTKSPLSPRTIRRLPQMSFCVESMMPYHTATASALLNSMLSFSPRSFGWLSDASDDV